MRVSPSLLTLAGSLLAGQVLSKPFGLNPSYNSVNGLGVNNKTASAVNLTYVTATTTLSTTTTSTASVAVVSVNNGTITSLSSEFHGAVTSSTWTSDDIVFTTSTLTLTSTFTDSIPSDAAGSASNDSGKLTAACTATATVTNTVTQTTSVTLTSISYITVSCVGTSQTTAVGSSVSTSWLGDKSPNPTEPVVVLTTTVPVFPVPSSSGMNSIVTTAYDSTTYTIQVFPPSEMSSTVSASSTDTIVKQSPKVTESVSGASSQDVTIHITSTITQQGTRTSVVHPLPSGNGTASLGNGTSSDSGADDDVTVFLTSSSTTTVTAPYGNSTVTTSLATGNNDTTVTVSSTLRLTSTAPFSNSSGISTVSSDDVTVTSTSIQLLTSTMSGNVSSSGISTVSSNDVTVTTTSIQFSTSTMSSNVSSPATDSATDQVVSISSTKTLTFTCSSHTSVVLPSSIATSSLSSEDVTVTTTTTTRITSTLSPPGSAVATASNAVVSLSAPSPYFALGTATANKQRRSAPSDDTMSAESTVFAPPGRSSATVQAPAIATVPLAPSVIAQRPTVTPSQPKSMGTIGVTTQIPSSSSSAPAPYVLMSLPPNANTSSASLDVIMSLAPDMPATPSAPFVLMSLPPVVTMSNSSSIASALTSTSVPLIPTSCPPGMQYGNYPENFLRYSPGYRAVDALKKPGLSVYDPKQNPGATETLDVLGLRYGEIGAASHAGDSQYWYNFTSVDLACMGSACTIEISAMKYDIFKWREYAAHTITMWAPGCDKAENCTMMHRQLLPADKFTGLSGIQIVAYNDSGHTTAGKRPLAPFAIEKLDLGWFNTTCEAGTWRVIHQ